MESVLITNMHVLAPFLSQCCYENPRAENRAIRVLSMGIMGPRVIFLGDFAFARLEIILSKNSMVL